MASHDSLTSAPERWLNCPRRSKIIAGKFLVTKTFLNSNFDESVPSESRFSPEMITCFKNSYKMNIGLVVDLTKARRYYKPEDVEATGVKYCKISCSGQHEPPTADQVSAFIGVCKTFFMKNGESGGLILVHCTHGFNRSGYMICSYLVEEETWNLHTAVHHFSECRPPGIYKQSYLDQLIQVYEKQQSGANDNKSLEEEEESMRILAPLLPDWCFTDKPKVAEMESNDAAGNSDLPESDTSEFACEVQRAVESHKMIQRVKCREQSEKLRQMCRRLLNTNKKHFPGCQPVSLDSENLELLAKDEYLVSWKADGVRYMMMILDDEKKYLIDRKYNFFEVQNLKLPSNKESSKFIMYSIFDGEMVLDKTPLIHHPASSQNANTKSLSDVKSENSDESTTTSTPTVPALSTETVSILRYLVYDVPVFDQAIVGGENFDKRLEILKKFVMEPRDKACLSGNIDKSQEPFSFRMKDFFHKTKSKWLLEKFTKGLTHDFDGLVFQPKEMPYVLDRCDQVLKWKPSSLNSIDFYFDWVRVKRDGCIPENIGYLYVLNMIEPFATIKVTKELMKYRKKIIECTYDPKIGWNMIRERTDKNHPNSVKTASGVLKSILHPVSKELLYQALKINQDRPNSFHAPTASTAPPPN